MPPLKLSPFVSSFSRLRIGAAATTSAASPLQAAVQQTRWAHDASSTAESSAAAAARSSRELKIPAPIPLVPDVATFLKVIGRGLSQHVSKFPTWEALFTLTSDQLKELGIEPPRTRRYLISWRRKFLEGRFGIGGDLKHVVDGAAELRILETRVQGSLDPKKVVVNVPPGTKPESLAPSECVRVKGFKISGVSEISGPFALPLKGRAGSRLTVTEGMWEDKRGRKIDGGERRRKEVRFKRRVAERRALREAQGFY